MLGNEIKKQVKTNDVNPCLLIKPMTQVIWSEAPNFEKPRSPNFNKSNVKVWNWKKIQKKKK
jgi:hypothetical protein